mmetsp:Transcript_21681/g.24866  ORF Transcript_21681/g.24866 Transcript_21681/m.24866 type:complete len:104 (-) Transcript_21681:366-677(-)|eukprot:CAMPEP_0194359988 /NCGR_PEP_ID=MMETSP0174-20130528/7284_1 /TAXON_ID=216777 /ORGANISM="Proboscia alata, Strain PI-D3" /LENGTH=103 /DNA_ID=CAMNT_0039131211 /DNA_START=308 /DNA_END=619 /DNA_ORIENTATION=-
MSEVEETLERIKAQPGVEGYVICNSGGAVLRRLPSMSQELAEQYAESTYPLALKARNVVRDLDPKNDLRNLRIRAKRKELLVSFDNDYLVILVQQWMPVSASS